VNTIFVLDRADTLARHREFDCSLLPGGPRPETEPRTGDEGLGICYLQSCACGTQELLLGEPLKIEIRRGEDSPFSVYAPFIEVGGTGETREAAIADLLATARDVCDGLRSTPTSKLHPTRSACSRVWIESFADDQAGISTDLSAVRSEERFHQGAEPRP